MGAQSAAVVVETGIFQRAWEAGPIVFGILLILILMSVLAWAIATSKWFFLKQLELRSERFIKSFWDSRSLNDLNSRLTDYQSSPAKEIFRLGYSELVRTSQMREAHTPIGIKAALDNLTRTIDKAKMRERQVMEKFLFVLSITASAAPFIGLFGTVWGIMNAFEGIARSGSASLAAVAPGISEALIATAFGLAAAIPAAIGYNLAVMRIRAQLVQLDGFGVDFLNIVERYLVNDRKPTSEPS